MPLPQTPAPSLLRLGSPTSATTLIEALADASIGCFEIDLQTHETHWSDALFRLFCVDPLATDAAAEAQRRIHPDDIASSVAAVEQALTAGADARYVADWRVLQPDGGVRWLSARGRVVRGADAAGVAVSTLVGVVSDDTSRRAARAELAATEERRDRFLALLAHDLRNPLAPLHTAAELMRRADMQPARVIAISDMLSRQVAQMSHLIDDLVDVSRANQGRIELRRQTVAVRAAVAQSVASVQAFVERRRQSIETRFDDSALTVEVDPDRLQQILTHLLQHASRSSTEDAVIRVDAAGQAGGVVLNVSDDGAGIEADRLGHAFDLYPSADVDPMRRQTLGTGMALVKALTLLHGGSVEAASAGAGRGARYTVRLPVACVDASGSVRVQR